MDLINRLSSISFYGLKTLPEYLMIVEIEMPIILIMYEGSLTWCYVYRKVGKMWNGCDVDAYWMSVSVYVKSIKIFSIENFLTHTHTHIHECNHAQKKRVITIFFLPSFFSTAYQKFIKFDFPNNNNNSNSTVFEINKHFSPQEPYIVHILNTNVDSIIYYVSFCVYMCVRGYL